MGLIDEELSSDSISPQNVDGFYQCNDVNNTTCGKVGEKLFYCESK